MSKFKSKLEVESVGQRKWKLLADLIYDSDIVGTIIVPTGFKTDLLSTWGIPIAAECLDGDDSPPAVVHDYLYTKHLFSRSTADAILREACIVNGKSRVKAFFIWAGVRLFGWSHWN